MAEQRTRTESKVLCIEFSMGENDEVDIRAGGPKTLAFWTCADLSRSDIEAVAGDPELQAEIKARGGNGTFTIQEKWTGSFAKDKDGLKRRCLELVRTNF